MTDPTPEQLAEKTTCQHCGVLFDYPPDVRVITTRDRRAPNGLRKLEMKFCSIRCASHCQMAHEG